MSEWKSNIPEDLDLNKRYAPIKSDFEKKLASERSKLLATDPQWIAIHDSGIKTRNQDPNYHKKRNQALSKTYQDPVWQENIQKGADKRHADPAWQKAWKESYTPESNKRRSDSCKKTLGTVENKKRASVHSTSLWQNKEHRAKMQQCVKTPLGVFESHAEAAEAYGIGRGAFSNKFKREHIKNIDLWKNITREEYDKIKG